MGAYGAAPLIPRGGPLRPHPLSPIYFFKIRTLAEKCRDDESENRN